MTREILRWKLQSAIAVVKYVTSERPLTIPTAETRVKAACRITTAIRCFTQLYTLRHTGATTSCAPCYGLHVPWFGGYGVRSQHRDASVLHRIMT
jgi:hypothetical protein